MATNQDLFLSILALDAYNRGTNRGMIIPDDQLTIGTANIARDSSDLPGANPASFYAVAYEWAGKTVISYRGTSFDGAIGPNLGDVINGWSLSAGFSGAAQATLAKDFYTAVTGQQSVYRLHPPM